MSSYDRRCGENRISAASLGDPEAQKKSVEERDAAMMVLWTDTLAIGIDAIDREHRQIIDAVNRLTEIVPEEKWSDDATKLFGDVIDLIGNHFRSEEVIMVASRYPATDAHIRLHSEFFNELTRLLYLLETGHSGVAQGLLRCIHDWAFGHIVGHDRKIAEYLAVLRTSPPR